MNNNKSKSNHNDTNNKKDTKSIKGYGLRVKFEEITSLESLITRRPTEKYQRFVKVVQSNNPIAVLEAFPHFICLFAKVEQAEKAYETLKSEFDTVELSDHELTFEEPSTKKEKNNRA